jgi:sn-glycerol 3-phosphate transport system substrate-binding protein
MPFNTSSPVLVYNRGMFERTGLDPDRPPETFEDVVETSRRLVDGGVTDYGIAFGKYSFFYEEWLAGQNAPLVDERNGRARTATEAYVDSEASRNVFEWLASMADDGLYYDPDAGSFGSPEDAFFDGHAAMHVSTTSSLSQLEDSAAENGFDLGVGYFPAYEEHHGVVVGGGSLWVADDLDPEVRSAAGEFLAFLTEPEQQARWHRETGCFPVHLDAMDSLRSEGWFDENPHYATTIEQLREGPDTPATNGARIGPFNTVRTVVEEGLSEATVDNVDEVLERTNEQVERKLREYETEQDGTV